ncbi:hypothetical protein BGZ47_007899 [Haplosporangium gracile]|nr:hypothetical protein BGZ47_007899 [Haplosporangium gracile]
MIETPAFLTTPPPWEAYDSQNDEGPMPRRHDPTPGAKLSRWNLDDLELNISETDFRSVLEHTPNLIELVLPNVHSVVDAQALRCRID